MEGAGHYSGTDTKLLLADVFTDCRDRVSDGSIMKCMSRSHTYYFSSEKNFPPLFFALGRTNWFCRRPINYVPPGQ